LKLVRLVAVAQPAAEALSRLRDSDSETKTVSDSWSLTVDSSTHSIYRTPVHRTKLLLIPHHKSGGYLEML